jgi:predicted lipoprotein with Yx(FWY)xxD motif
MSTRIWIAAAAATVLAAAGCSSSGSNSGSGGGSSQPAGGSNAVTITVTHDRLTAPNGKTLYYNTVDTASSIKCVDECTKEWPPLLGTPKAGSGIDDEDLSTAKRPDGSIQVLFYGHPLYEFDEDSPGDAKGQGVADEGGHWVVANPQQAAKAGSATPSEDNMHSSSGGGGYGY